MNATDKRDDARPETPARAIRVTCTARLHLGFLDLNGGLPRRFGSLGLALDAPRTRLVLRHAPEPRVEGPDATRAAEHLSQMERQLGLPPRHALALEAAIPTHAGLGSGTQLALAVATAVRRLHGLPIDLRGDAERLGRGARSGIGIGLFRTGGLVVDGGRGPRPAPPPILARLAFPPEWRVLLVLDPNHRGLSGDAERHAFAALTPMPQAAAGEICRLVLMQAMPAIAEQDLPSFGAAVTHIQSLLGAHFAPAQGGVTTSARVGHALRRLAASGADGTGQTSWGPTGFAFARNAIEAERLATQIRISPEAEGLDLLVCRALNRGASITATAGAVRPVAEETA